MVIGDPKRLRYHGGGVIGQAYLHVHPDLVVWTFISNSDRTRDSVRFGYKISYNGRKTAAWALTETLAVIITICRFYS